jgi:hypothetical protein
VKSKLKSIGQYIDENKGDGFMPEVGSISPNINSLTLFYSSPPTLANFVGSVLSHSLNSGHTATLRSAQIVSFGNDFACPQPLYEIYKNMYEAKI